MLVDGRPLRFSWVWGSPYLGILDAYLAIDAPGIRDLRWATSHKNKLRIRELFPSIKDDATEAEIAIPLFNDNLDLFNANSGRELDVGGYTFITGATTKRAALNVATLNYIIHGVMEFNESTLIEQGATLNDLMMIDAFKANDGAVPTYSQRAQDISFRAPTKVVYRGGIDHEEFYGGEPDSRTPEALAKGREIAYDTFGESQLNHLSRSCPQLKPMAEIQNDLLVVTGRVVFPIYDTASGGDGKPGDRIQRMEARYRLYGEVVPGFNFTVMSDGSFRGTIAPNSLWDSPIDVVALWRDGSQTTGALERTRVTIQGATIVTYELVGGATEVTHDFEAHALPAGAYRYEWNFDDGQPLVNQQPASGQNSKLSHTYRNLRNGDQFHPGVKLYNAQGKLLAQDHIEINIEGGAPPPNQGGVISVNSADGLCRITATISGNDLGPIQTNEYGSIIVSAPPSGGNVKLKYVFKAPPPDCPEQHGKTYYRLRCSVGVLDAHWQQDVVEQQGCSGTWPFTLERNLDTHRDLDMHGSLYPGFGGYSVVSLFVHIRRRPAFINFPANQLRTVYAGEYTNVEFFYTALMDPDHRDIGTAIGLPPGMMLRDGSHYEDTLLDSSYIHGTPSATGRYDVAITMSNFAGNILIGSTKTNFTMDVLARPLSVSEVWPADQEVLETFLWVDTEFSQIIDAGSVNPNTFRISYATGGTVAGSFDIQGDSVNFYPDNDAEAYGRQIIVTLKGGSGGIRSIYGGLLPQDYSWSFRVLTAAGSRQRGNP